MTTITGSFLVSFPSLPPPPGTTVVALLPARQVDLGDRRQPLSLKTSSSSPLIPALHQPPKWLSGPLSGPTTCSAKAVTVPGCPNSDHDSATHLGYWHTARHRPSDARSFGPALSNCLTRFWFNYFLARTWSVSPRLCSGNYLKGLKHFGILPNLTF